MSAHIVTAPDLSVNVRCTRESEENRGEEEEYQVTFDGFLEDNEHHTDPGSLKARPNTQKTPAAVNRVSFRTPAVVLGVMYLLILAGIFIKYVLVSLEKYQLQNNYNQLQEIISDMAVNNSQMKSSYETLSKNYSQLQDEIKQLTDEMSANNNQLQDEIKQLKDQIKGKWCAEGWKRFGCSCYFKSNQKKTWSESRSDCQSKGADLVVINNKEEQKFLTGLNVDGEFWIGLRTSWNSGRWEWVDGSPLTETFWESGPPQYSAQQYGVVAYCNQQGLWTHTEGYYYYYGSRVEVQKYWICEK